MYLLVLKHLVSLKPVTKSSCRTQSCALQSFCIPDSSTRECFEKLKETKFKVAYDSIASIFHLSLLFGAWEDVVTLLLKRRYEISSLCHLSQSCAPGDYYRDFPLSPASCRYPLVSRSRQEAVATLFAGVI